MIEIAEDIHLLVRFSVEKPLTAEQRKRLEELAKQMIAGVEISLETVGLQGEVSVSTVIK